MPYNNSLWNPYQPPPPVPGQAPIQPVPFGQFGGPLATPTPNPVPGLATSRRPLGTFAGGGQPFAANSLGALNTPILSNTPNPLLNILGKSTEQNPNGGQGTFGPKPDLGQEEPKTTPIQGLGGIAGSYVVNSGNGLLGAGAASNTGSGVQAVGSSPTAAGEAGVMLDSGEVVSQGAADAMGASGSATGSAAGSTFGNVLGAVGAALGAYNLGNNIAHNRSDRWGGAASGAAIGSFINPGWGTAIGALGGLMLGGIGSSANPRELQRRAVRDRLVADTPLGAEADAIREQFGGPGAGFFNASGVLTPIEQQKINMESPFAAQAIAWVSPLATILAGGDVDIGQDIGAMFAHAVMSGATTINEVKQNVLSLIQTFGYSYDRSVLTLQEIRDAGLIDDETFGVYQRNMDNLATDVEGNTPGIPADYTGPTGEIDLEEFPVDPPRIERPDPDLSRKDRIPEDYHKGHVHDG